MTNNSKGCLFMAIPPVGIFVVLCLWSIVSFVVASSAGIDAPSATTMTVVRIVNVVLGFLGIISIIAIPVGLIAGIVFFLKKEPTQNSPQPPQQPGL